MLDKQDAKKGDKEKLQNYRPVPLLPICDKVLEKLIFNNLFKHLIYNDLISENQSGFNRVDSCII